MRSDEHRHQQLGSRFRVVKTIPVLDNLRVHEIELPTQRTPTLKICVIGTRRDAVQKNAPLRCGGGPPPADARRAPGRCGRRHATGTGSGPARTSLGHRRRARRPRTPPRPHPAHRGRAGRATSRPLRGGNTTTPLNTGSRLKIGPSRPNLQVCKFRPVNPQRPLVERERVISTPPREHHHVVGIGPMNRKLEIPA